MDFDLVHMTTTSTFTVIDSLKPIFQHSFTHIGRNADNFAFDMVPELL